MSWRLPGYVVEDLLGYGASGDVWRGRVAATGDPVALKRVPVADPVQAQAARAEAALLSTLDHPHLVRLHELVPTSDAVVLVLDLAAGGSLADLLARRGRLTPGEVISALAPIGAALAYAHNEGVVHGDVTPANVLFTERGVPLLADLGVARIVGDAAPVRSTPSYIDPAVAAGSAPGAPSDVFMLAAVAVHALTGEQMWTGATPAEVLAAAAAGATGDLSARLAGLPDDLAAVLARALAVEPHLRCPAAEFALDLRHSGEPVPVELGAGRVRLPVVAPERNGYRAAHRAADDEQAADDAGAEPGDDPAEILAAARANPGRPAFERPGLPDAAAEPSQLTHSVRAALRPTLPPPRRRLRSALTGRAARLGAVVAVVLAATVTAGLVWSGRSDRARAAAPATPTKPTPTKPTPTSRAATRSSPSPAALDAAAAAGVLSALDDLRQRAFARDDPSLLARVYRPGSLLTQDDALLARAVPKGCQLIGVHTTYSGVQVAKRSGARVVVRATAQLAPSTLRCGGTKAGTASGAGPTPLRIELVAESDGYRIAGQTTR